MKRGRMLNFREKLRRAVTRRHDEYAPCFLLNSRDKLQVSTATYPKEKSAFNKPVDLRKLRGEVNFVTEL